MIRYAHDKANPEKGLQELMNWFYTVAKKYSMKIIVKKTKVMCISRKGKVRLLIDDQQVEQVSQFKY